MTPGTVLYITWAVSAAALLALGVTLGLVIGRGFLGLLIDQRGRYSLSQFQLVAWTIVLVSLFAGVFAGRLAAHADGSALNFQIPPELLAVLGISAGSTVTALTIKSTQDHLQPASIPINTPTFPARLAQIFLVEQGDQADKVIDISKFQNFWFTLLVLAGYISAVIGAVNKQPSLTGFALPVFSGTLLALLAISHAGYLAGKLPVRAGVPDGPTMLSATNPTELGRNQVLAVKAATPRYTTRRTTVARRRLVDEARPVRTPTPRP
jgi:hypothetical protein